ncbi:MAG: hypothetical protein D6759_01095, partial [Chloroflexi bacterium]
IPLAEARREGLGSRLERWVITLLLLAAVLTPLLLGTRLFPTANPTGNDAQGIYTAIEDQVAAGDTVLVVFDYGLGRAGEMDPIARVLLRHLAQRQARILTLSLRPEGALLAQLALSGLNREVGYLPDQDYVNLGYLPGEAVAIRRLSRQGGGFYGRDLRGRKLNTLPVIQSAPAIEEVSLVVILEADPEALRWWVEQAAIPLGRPLVAGVSAAIAPLARPYRESEQLRGLVSGLAGAADYERLLGEGPSAPATLRLDAQMLAQVAIVLLILLGLVTQSVRRGRSHR